MKIREALLSDVRGIAEVHVDSWITTYTNIVPAAYLKRLTYEGREQLWRENISVNEVFVAENNDGQIVGFSSGGKERSGHYPDYKGELYAIYVLEDDQRSGIGERLLKPIIDQLQQQNIFTMIVFVLEENPSRKFYEFLGAEKIDSVQMELSGKTFNEIVYGWNDISKIEYNLRTHRREC